MTLLSIFSSVFKTMLPVSFSVRIKLILFKTLLSFLALHWLPVSKHIQYKISVICFKCLNGFATMYLSNSLYIYTPLHSLSSFSDTLEFCIPWIRQYIWSVFIFCLQSSYLLPWNELPLYIHWKSSVSSFKISLQTDLFLFP